MPPRDFFVCLHMIHMHTKLHSPTSIWREGLQILSSSRWRCMVILPHTFPQPIKYQVFHHFWCMCRFVKTFVSNNNINSFRSNRAFAPLGNQTLIKVHTAVFTHYWSSVCSGIENCIMSLMALGELCPLIK